MTRLSFLLAALLLSTQLAAEPAPFYIWRSKVDGKSVCAQTGLGPGWERAAGPFHDSRCQKRIVVK
ncbi:MAG: hypothetical protein M3Y65_07515 [Pseudomonadota bacterium]|nr:hypothetical protein [Pseudomonadota bacterium]